MDNGSRNQQQQQQHQHLGVNKMGKNIKKSPLHQPNFANHNQRMNPHPHQYGQHPPPLLHQQQQQQPPPPPQPQVYNISKNDFRNVVQRLTGTPSRDPSPHMGNQPPPGPPQPKPPSQRLLKIRPPPLTPFARPAPPPLHNQAHNPNPNLNPNPHPHPHPNPPAFARPGAPADSPVSAYMRYLESSLFTPPNTNPNPRPSGLLPTPPPHSFPSPRGGPPPTHPFPSPRGGLPPLSPLLPSATAFFNPLSPRSPFPLLSPGCQHPPPLTPNFLFSPLASQSGILGPGPQMPPSPMFPQSPSGFFPLMSPTWRDLL